MCFCQFNLWYKFMLRYFTCSVCGNLFLLRWTGKQFFLPLVNVISTDLDSFTFILYFSIHDWTQLRLSSSILEAMIGSSCDANITMSSAKVATIVFFVFGSFAMYIRYNTGPRALPWVTSNVLPKNTFCWCMISVPWRIDNAGSF